MIGLNDFVKRPLKMKKISHVRCHIITLTGGHDRIYLLKKFNYYIGNVVESL